MIEIKKPEITYIKNLEDPTNLHGRFILEPLERGYGTTLGNTLRRVLLSSLPGVGIAEINIEGVLHEFSCINEVREDVTEICLNLKGVVARYNDGCNESKRAVIDVTGPRIVTAGDIQGECEGLEIINKDHHIATLNKGGKLRISLLFEKGRGFTPSEKRVATDKKVSTIVMDTRFSPVKKVSYEVHATRVGQDINYDKLILDVWTNGSIQADEAVSMAASFFDEYLNIFIQYKDDESEKLVLVSNQKEEPNAALKIPVKELEFSVRSRNCLKRGNIKELGDLTKLSSNDLLQIKNFGKKSLVEIREKLAQYSLSLKGEKVEDYLNNDEEIDSI
ncbi:MAG: DNA-directed RNA polymerase subunit alpha [Candidatus Wallbacteria bacterium HGW-Wallbacteria-1]|jgi:DNA-directed RNA polymerase subunit alpha|uniref:DNA-directed RNA polymerase subunit alpha n=1 Tax=Candidatus Wallbacteria bacterium HGW-Wallbacteria-1 TaxID=2013854 RepID=A0A2N1PSU3_9BACT|nr:MAG: DNA-directed RNA polymerase subunit alpha [Candidatus Wallbacteria bacterium HGW-Wallbacteria-1]